MWQKMKHKGDIYLNCQDEIGCWNVWHTKLLLLTTILQLSIPLWRAPSKMAPLCRKPWKRLYWGFEWRPGWMNAHTSLPTSLPLKIGTLGVSHPLDSFDGSRRQYWTSAYILHNMAIFGEIWYLATLTEFLKCAASLHFFTNCMCYVKY